MIRPLFRNSLLCSALLVAVACSKSNTEEKFESDSMRKIDEPRYSFVADKPAIEIKDLDSSEERSLFGCDEKSSHERLKREKYSISVGVLKRSLLEDMSEASLVNEVQTTYETENSDEVYKLTTEVVRNEVAGQETLSKGPYAYVETCTKSSGCDPEQRVFTSGSPDYVREVIRNENRLNIQAYTSGAFNGCEFRTSTNVDLDRESLALSGTIKIGDKEYPAVQVTESKQGIIECSKIEGRGFDLGKGSRVIKKIYLKDRLPEFSNTGSFPSLDDNSEFLTTSRLRCRRTLVFYSQSDRFGDEIINSESSEMTNYTLVGELPNIDTWKAEQKGISTSIEDLKKEIELKKLEADHRMEAAENAKLYLKKEKDILRERQDTLKAYEDNGASEEKIKHARANVEASQKDVEAQNEKVLETASQHKTALINLEKAQKNLTDYIEANGWGEE